jgi:hypothetical protein
MMVGWAVLVLGQTATLVAADAAAEGAPDAAPPAPASVEGVHPLPSYWLAYVVVALLIGGGIFLVCSPRLYPEEARDKFQPFR